MRLNTASAIISFARNLEEDSARCYEALARRYVKEEATFLSFARENRRNIAQIERTYYGVITDAIEGCFAFDIDPEEYAVPDNLAEKMSHAEALDGMLEMEDRIIKFYADAAGQSKVLMADVSRVFGIVVRKRKDRKTRLEALRLE
jgi:rubrerythrin